MQTGAPQLLFATVMTRKPCFLLISQILGTLNHWIPSKLPWFLHLFIHLVYLQMYLLIHNSLCWHVISISKWCNSRSSISPNSFPAASFNMCRDRTRNLTLSKHGLNINPLLKVWFLKHLGTWTFITKHVEFFQISCVPTWVQPPFLKTLSLFKLEHWFS